MSYAKYLHPVIDCHDHVKEFTMHVCIL